MNQCSRPLCKASTRSNSGFTLLELVMVGIILTLLLTAGLELYRNYETQRQRSVTSERIALVTRVIEDYLSIEGSYPCPSTLGYGDSETQGAPLTCPIAATDVPDNTCSTDPNALVCVQKADADRDTDSDRVIIGAVPFRALPIREEDTFDGYGSRLYYAVSQDLTRPSTFKLENAGIRVVNKDGKDLVEPRGSARYVVFSVGPNRVGGYNARGVVDRACDNASYTGIDYENCDFLDGADGGEEADFVREQLYNADGSNIYDDVLAFESFDSEAAVIGWRRGETDAGEDPSNLIMPFRNVMVGSLSKSVDAAMAVMGSGGVWAQDVDGATPGKLRADQICDAAGDCFAVSELVRTCPSGTYVTGIGKGQKAADGSSTRVYCNPIEVGCPQGSGSGTENKILAGINTLTGVAECVNPPNDIPDEGGQPPDTGDNSANPIDKYCADNPTDPLCTATGDYEDWYCSQPGNDGTQLCSDAPGLMKLKCLKVTGPGGECDTWGDVICVLNPDAGVCLPATEGYCYKNPTDPRCSGQSDDDGVCEEYEACYGDGSGDDDGDGTCEAGEVCFGDDGGGSSDCDNLEYCFGGGDDRDGTCEVNETCYGDGSGDGDADGTCETGEGCFDDTDGVCETGEACYGGGGGDGDGDGTCEMGEACYTDGDGICESGEACYGDGSGDDNLDGICQNDEDCFGDDGPGVGSGGCSSGWSPQPVSRDCTPENLQQYGGYEDISGNDPDKVNVDFKFLTDITTTETGDTTSGRVGGRSFTVKTLRACHADGTSEDVVVSNTALGTSTGAQGSSGCCNVKEFTPKWRWFRCNNKTTASDDNTAVPDNSANDCDGPYYSNEMVDETSTLKLDNGYVNGTLDAGKSRLDNTKIHEQFLKNYSSNKLSYLTGASSGGCDWNATEGIVFQVPVFSTTQCGVQWRTVPTTDPVFGFTNVGSAKTIQAASQASTLELQLNDTGGLAAGDLVYIKDVAGMAELNNKHFKIKSVEAGNKIRLMEPGDANAQKWRASGTSYTQIDGTYTVDNPRDIDSTKFTPYTSGGTVQEVTGAGAFKDLPPTSCVPTSGRIAYGMKATRTPAPYPQYNGERACSDILDPSGKPYKYHVTEKCRWVIAGVSSTVSNGTDNPDGVFRATYTGGMPTDPGSGVKYHPGTCVRGKFQWGQGPTPSGPVIGQQPDAYPEIGSACDPDPDNDVDTASPTSKCWKSLSGSGWQVYNECPCNPVNPTCVGLEGDGPFPPTVTKDTASSGTARTTDWPKFTGGNIPSP